MYFNVNDEIVEVYFAVARGKSPPKSPAPAGTWKRDALPSRGVTDIAKNPGSACFC
jgi:hypothetical protein